MGRLIVSAVGWLILLGGRAAYGQAAGEAQGSLKRGDKVITAGGIYGEIESVGDTSVVLVLEDGAKVRLAKSSIVRKQDK